MTGRPVKPPKKSLKPRKPKPRSPAKSNLPASNSKISDEVRAFIIMSYARFARTTDIAKAVLEQFGVELDSSTLNNHKLDRETRANSLGSRWCKLFDETRTEFLNSIDRIPIAHPAYRLAKMQRYFDILDQKDAIGPAMSVLEQAAKEAGGAFTNKRELAGKVKVEDDTPQRDTTEMRAALVAAIEDALHDLGKGPAQPTQH